MIRILVFILFMAVCPRVFDAPAPVARLQPRYDEIACMAWVIDDEARGEPLRGARAVYDVVKHRMEVRKLTACEVVMQHKQFSGYSPGKQLRITPEMLTRYRKVSRMAPVVPKAEYFHASYVQPSWASEMKLKMKIGLHLFYEKVKPKQPAKATPKEKHK